MTILTQNSIAYWQTGGTSSGVVATNPSTLMVFQCTNISGGLLYLQFFDRTTAPTNGTAPFSGHSYPVYPNGGLTEGGVDILGEYGAPFPTGLAWGISTTPLTFTAAASDSVILRLRYN